MATRDPATTDDPNRDRQAARTTRRDTADTAARTDAQPQRIAGREITTARGTPTSTPQTTGSTEDDPVVGRQVREDSERRAREREEARVAGMTGGAMTTANTGGAMTGGAAPAGATTGTATSGTTGAAATGAGTTGGTTTGTGGAR